MQLKSLVMLDRHDMKFAQLSCPECELFVGEGWAFVIETHMQASE